eukprot:jgi/Botrbrau1/20119/Bobra.0173s0022.1
MRSKIQFALICIATYHGGFRASKIGYVSGYDLKDPSNDFVMPAEAPAEGAFAPKASSWRSAIAQKIASTFLKPPFEHNFSSGGFYDFLGVGFVNSTGGENLVPDPAFTYPPVTVINLYYWKVLGGPCGAFDFGGYVVGSLYKGTGEPEFALHAGHLWSSKAECCGYGTPLWYPCTVAEFKWTPLPDGTEQVALYYPSDLNSPFLTIHHWLPLPNLYQKVPDSPEWPKWPEYLGVFQWGNDDIASVTNGTVDGRPVIVGHVYNHWEFYNNEQTFAIFLGFGGTEASTLSSYFFVPLGVHYPAGGTVRIQTRPYNK